MYRFVYVRHCVIRHRAALRYVALHAAALAHSFEHTVTDPGLEVDRDVYSLHGFDRDLDIFIKLRCNRNFF